MRRARQRRSPRPGRGRPSQGRSAKGPAPRRTARFSQYGEAFASLCEVMARLRGPGGCPWDAEQTFATLKPYLLEEAYEALDAVDGPAESHRDELGDLLLQIVFQSEIAQETGRFDVAQVAEAIRAKLIRRHPHVFGKAKVARTAAGALANWEALKAKERSDDTSALAGVPRALPALLRALRSGEKAAAVGFDWTSAAGAATKVEEEWREVRAHLDGPGPPDKAGLAEELGDLLFSLVNVCRHLGVDPEMSLRGAVDKFARRFLHVERETRGRGLDMKSLGLAELDRLWVEAKSRESMDRPSASAKR